MPGDLFTLTGTFIGAVGLSWATFTGVSYLEVKRKIDEAVDLGDQPYELKTEQKAVRRPKPVKKALSKKDRLKRK